MITLVTGGAGFVARTLIERLLDRGDNVVALDNLSRGALVNVSGFDNHPGFRFVKADLSNINEYRSALSSGVLNGEVDEVWHLAANSDIPAGIANAQIDLRDTFMTTFNTLEIMQELGVRRLFFASSSAIYGDFGSRSLTEDIGPLFPISNYGAMKLASEAAITAAAEKFLDVALLFRFPNVVGVPATHGVILDFVRRLVRDPKELKVLGNGTQQKAYLHVSDLVDAMLMIQKHVVAGVDAFNIGPSDDGVTVREIAEETVAAAAPGAELTFGQGNKGWVGDVPQFSYSTAKAQSLGWVPRMTSLEAVRRAISEIVVQEGVK
jgi:UDP-glucose 4-epimerase